MSQPVIYKLKPLIRLLISLLCFGVVFILLPQQLMLIEKAALSYIGFALMYLILDWLIIAKATPADINKLADVEDGSRAYVWAMLFLFALASIVVVILLITGKQQMNLGTGLFVGTTLGGLFLSWSLIHTLFTLHYARLYYRSEIDKVLEIPGCTAPDYLDFAYFSFGIGCTFQTADININGRQMRRTVLAHSIISFFINTVIVALTINLVAGLSS